MHKTNCWIDSNKKSHLFKDDCIKSELINIVDNNTDSIDFDAIEEIITLFLNKKEQFIDYLSQYKEDENV